MASETQYYQAKVFLKAYNEAFSTLDDVHRNNYLLAKNNTYKNLLLSGYNKREISIKDGHVVTQKNFNNSMIKSLGVFSAKRFSEDLLKFEGVQSFSQLTKMLEEKAQ